MSILQSEDYIYNIQLSDKIQHPVFGLIRVDGIFPKEEVLTDEESEYELHCTLLDFNDTLKIFDALDIQRVKYQRKTSIRSLK